MIQPDEAEEGQLVVTEDGEVGVIAEACERGAYVRVPPPPLAGETIFYHWFSLTAKESSQRKVD